MSKTLIIKDKIKKFNKQIRVSGDKSLSIRWVLLASQAIGKSKGYNLLMSEDVLAAIDSIKKLGIKVRIQKNYCEIVGNGINGFKYNKNLTIDAKNSGTLGRLILGLIIKSPKKIKIIGDKSLSKRDFSRVTTPLRKFGVKFSYKIKNKLPLTILGTQSAKSIKYFENKGSAQCKSSVMLAALNASGTTSIKAKKSRNHTELLFKYLKIPIKVRKTKKFDFIDIKKQKKINTLNYQIPGDISSSAFFMVLTTLADNSKLLIKSSKKLKAINCPVELNSSAIDEFLVIFLIAAKAKGISYFKDLSELNQKESPRLIWGSKILNMMGIKTDLTNDSIKIYGQPDLEIKKPITVKNYLKDHRVFMMSTIAALTFGGKWKIYDKDSINTSFPSFLKIIKNINNSSL